MDGGDCELTAPSVRAATAAGVRCIGLSWAWPAMFCNLPWRVHRSLLVCLLLYTAASLRALRRGSDGLGNSPVR